MASKGWSVDEECEEECFSRHWIFRRKVEFEGSEHGSIGEENVAELLREKEELMRRLERIRADRQCTRRLSPKSSSMQVEVSHRLVAAQYSHALALSSLQSTQTQHASKIRQFDQMQKWHVLSDAFLIWHDGPFGTINGFRLGRGASTAVSKGEGDKSFFFSRKAPPAPPRSYVTVGWNEINSALGQVCLLLCTLRRIPNSGVEFDGHALLPCGSASKIGFLNNSQHSRARRPEHCGERRKIFHTSPEVTWYNLFHYEENGSYLSMGYYSRRNFNMALEGLVYCIAEVCALVDGRDVALSVPHAINVGGLAVGRDAKSGDGSVTVGGVGMQYDPEEGERWTVVWRYLLTDLKWIIAYFAKHVER